MIIKSMIDTDLYKFTMQQVAFYKFTDVNVKYAFKLRNYPSKIILPFIDDIREEIMDLSKLRMKSEEIDFLSKLSFMYPGYIEFLRYHRMDPERFVNVFEKDGEVKIEITGPWLNTILFEVPILAIVSEIVSPSLLVDTTVEVPDINNGAETNFTKVCKNLIQIGQPPIEAFKRLEEKIKYVQNSGRGLKFADFGTRRRYSTAWQDHVIKRITEEIPGNFVGTSNVYFAMKYGVKPIGTMAHEYIQCAQALVRLVDSQKFALQTWADVYRGNLGIALTDTLGMDAFLNDFDMYFAKLFDGARQDSGDPITWGNKLISHYESMKINPKTKTAVFSDGLDFKKACEINDIFSDKINVSFGIGTNLTNDVGMKPMQIVIKMVQAGRYSEMKPVAKISDSPGKQMCEDNDYLKYLRSVFKIKEE